MRRAGRVFLPALLFLTLAACARLPQFEPVLAPTEPAAALTLKPVPFEEIDGWGEDDMRSAIAPFLLSCQRLADQPAEQPMGIDPRMGSIGDWRRLCGQASEYAGATNQTVRYFIESRFRPYRVSANGSSKGLFTGYFEPELNGSWQPGGPYQVPLYARPDDLIGADLGAFREEWRGTSIAGQLIDGRYVPYHSRAEINAGALRGHGLEILWVDNPIDAFFLHIQGSGRVRLASGDFVRVGYAGRNGHRYVPIGRELVGIGALSQEAVTMPAIRSWLESHPLAAQEIMNRNPSYIFFRVLEESAPVGAQGVPLTPGRSLAVDRRVIPLGVPVWLSTRDPRDEDRATSLNRLMIAQDTGSAIKGGVRGDVFWGAGAEAAHAAGVMKEPGMYYLLLPRAAPPLPSS